MARTQGTSARTQRLTALVATALLAVATGFAIGRVFLGHASTYRMIVAGLLSAGIAVAMERRGLLLAGLVSAAAMIVVVGLMVFPVTTWHGLPSLETLRAMIDAAGQVGQQARVQVAPTEPLAPLMLAALTATWAAIFSSHALAFRAGSPILALLPPIALVAFADTVLEEVVRPLYGVAFLIAATALIFADGLRRVQGWGPVWSGPGRQATLGVTAGRGARRVAAAAVAMAAISPLLIPGFGSTAVLDLSSSGDSVRVNPLVSVSANLQRDEPLPAFDVSSPAPFYWRLVALPDFDGTTWNPDRQASVQEVEDGSPLSVNSSISSTVPTETVTASFRATGDLEGPWLPIPFPATGADVGTDGLRWDPETGALSFADTVEEGSRYSVTALVVRPTIGDLRDQAAPDPDPLARYLAVPEDLSRTIGALAKDWTSAAPDTTYDRVMAIQEHFTGQEEGFVYDDSVDPRNDQDAMVHFLTESKRGFCQQFASSMAIMLRTIGIPARVAVGFTAGRYDDEQDVFHVTTEQAHAWVEVYFPSYGWLTFDPTPSRANLTAYPYLNPRADPAACSGPRCASTGGDRTVPGTPSGGPTFDARTGRFVNTGNLRGSDLETIPDRGVAGTGRGGLTPRTWLGLAALAALAVLALIPPLRTLRRRRRLRAAARQRPRTLILTTYDVFTERAGELGYPRARGQTLEEYRRHVGTGIGLASDEDAIAGLATLTSLTTGAAYAPGEPGPADAEAASEAAATTLKALRRKVGFGQRLRGAYRRP